MKYRLETRTPTPAGLNFDQLLNPQQLGAVEAKPQRMLILAGAGTGKTRTLTYRVARLAATGCPPEKIMLVTFTNRAAREMVERVEGILGAQMRRCEAGTFHHVGNRILRKYASAIGLSEDFTILDPEDSRDLLTQAVAAEGLPALTAKRFPSPKLIASMLGLAQGSLTSVTRTVHQRFPKFSERTDAIERVTRRYSERKADLNACDFDDLLVHWHHLLTKPEFASIAEELRSKYEHVLVDEYQDINTLQARIIDEMSREHGSLTCVGDDAQSIYSFRGADFQQIRRFRERHPDAQVLELTINYRSTPQVLELANRSLEQNQRQYKKQLRAVRDQGPVPALIPLRDVYQQAELVAQRVLELHHEQQIPLRQMCVLYRNHAHGLELQVELSRRQIPYSVRSGVRFFEQAHIKDVIAYLRARENPRDALAWARVLRLWPGVGTQTAERIAESIGGAIVPGGEGQADLSFAADPAGATGDRELATRVLNEAAASARGRQKPALESISELWQRICADRLANPGEAIRAVVKGHYSEYADRSFSNATTRKEDLEQLANYAERYGDAQQFLSELALVQGISAEQVVSGETPDDKMTLSTIHQAKGLEWRVVFAVGLADGRFPMAQALQDQDSLEEERRLFYVAATRAKDELYLCYPTTAEQKSGARKLMRPSRFLSELDRSPPVFDRWDIEEAQAPEITD